MNKTKGVGPSLRRARELLRGVRPLGCVSFAKAAELLGRSESTVRQWVKSGRLLTVRVAGERLIPRSEIRRESSPH